MPVAVDAGGAVGGYPTMDADYGTMATEESDYVPDDPTGGLIDFDALAGRFDVGPTSMAQADGWRIGRPALRDFFDVSDVTTDVTPQVPMYSDDTWDAMNPFSRNVIEQLDADRDAAKNIDTFVDMPTVTTPTTQGTYYGTTALGDTTLNTRPSFDVSGLGFNMDSTPTFSSDFFDPSSSALASPDISVQTTQAMAAERSAAQLDQAAQSAGVDVSSIDPAVAAPGGYVNLDALAGQITAAQEKQAVDVSNMSSEDINTAMALSSVSGLFPGISKALGPVVRPSGGLVTKTLLPVAAASTAVSNALAHERARQTAADIEETTQVDTFASGGQVQPLPEFVQDIVSKNTQKDKDKQAAIAAANREKKAAARRTALARQALKDSQAAAARAQAASEKQAAKAIADAQAVLAQSRNRDRGGPSQREINAAREVLSQIDTFDSGGMMTETQRAMRDVGYGGGFAAGRGDTGATGQGGWT